MSAGCLAPEWHTICEACERFIAFARRWFVCLLGGDDALVGGCQLRELRAHCISSTGWWWGLIVYWSWRCELSKCWRRSFGTRTTARAAGRARRNADRDPAFNSPPAPHSTTRCAHRNSLGQFSRRRAALRLSISAISSEIFVCFSIGSWFTSRPKHFADARPREKNPGH